MQPANSVRDPLLPSRYSRSRVALASRIARTGVVVTHVGEDGACAAANLHVGDHILNINSVPAADHQSAMCAPPRRANVPCANATLDSPSCHPPGG